MTARGLRRAAIAVVCAIFVICGCASMAAQRGPLDPSEAAKVEGGLEKLRGLNFIAPVPLTFESPDAAERMMAAEIAREHTDEELRIGGLSGAMAGLYPPGIDLKAETLKLLRNELVAFYDPRSKRMVVVHGNRRNLLGDMILAHELTHALQDQHFGVSATLDKVKDNDDQVLALKCVAEGDATVAGFGYVAGGLDNTVIARVVSNLDSLPHNFAANSPGIPRGIGIPMLFQYSAGANFIGEAYRRGGWSAVNALYINPPRSSQQIIHPALYFDHPSPPLQIDIGGYQAVLKDWKKVDDDTYGELLLRIIINGNAPAPVPDALARWAGDRMIILQKNRSLTLLWIVAFHDNSAAQHFATSYARILDHMRGEPNPHRLQVHGNAVLIAICSRCATLCRTGARHLACQHYRHGRAGARRSQVPHRRA